MTRGRYFMVGCGALGCELFKNFAMMGVACTTGKVTVTDDDVLPRPEKQCVRVCVCVSE